MIHIAIDPGLTGSVAAIDPDGQLILCADLPVIRDHKLAWIDSNQLTDLLMQCRNGAIAVSMLPELRAEAKKRQEAGVNQYSDSLRPTVGEAKDGHSGKAVMAAAKMVGARITVERSQPMPGQGVSSTFTTGCVLGSILAACQRIACPLDLVTAATWKRAMGLDSSKSVSLDKARLLFPTADLTRVKDHNRAEALLLAEYSRRVFVGKVAA